ncbi:hypothetical protein INR49_009591 [Caranx melampygus]|nr:hypothetical protein INR49_009591 [Caranx melampygus]
MGRSRSLCGHREEAEDVPQIPSVLLQMPPDTDSGLGPDGRTHALQQDRDARDSPGTWRREQQPARYRSDESTILHLRLGTEGHHCTQRR